MFSFNMVYIAFQKCILSLGDISIPWQSSKPVHSILKSINNNPFNSVPRQSGPPGPRGQTAPRVRRVGVVRRGGVGAVWAGPTVGAWPQRHAPVSTPAAQVRGNML